MPFNIIYSPAAEGHLKVFSARDRKIILDVVDEQLINQPTIETRNRKRLRPNFLATWELRIGDFRVYYEADTLTETVNIIAIGIKKHNRVFVGDKEYFL